MARFSSFRSSAMIALRFSSTVEPAPRGRSNPCLPVNPPAVIGLPHLQVQPVRLVEVRRLGVVRPFSVHRVEVEARRPSLQEIDRRDVVAEHDVRPVERQVVVDELADIRVAGRESGLSSGSRSHRRGDLVQDGVTELLAHAARAHAREPERRDVGLESCGERPLAATPALAEQSFADDEVALGSVVLFHDSPLSLRTSMLSEIPIPCARPPSPARVSGHWAGCRSGTASPRSSELIADPARGLVYGNRGCLHDDRGPDPAALQRQALDRVPARVPRLAALARSSSPGASPSSSSSTRRRRSPRGTARAPSAAARTTSASRTIWSELHPGEVGADAMDARLHAERVDPGTRAQRHHDARLDELPDGAFVLHRRRAVARRSAERSAAGRPRATAAGGSARPATAHVVLLTPPSLVAVLRAGWDPVVPLLHPSALSQG